MASRPELPAAASPGRPSAAGPVALFLVLAAAISAAGALSYRANAADHRRQVGRVLETVAALKVEEISRWREDRILDATFVAANPMLRAALSEARGAKGQRDLARWFELLRADGDFVSLDVVSADGTVAFTTGDPAPDCSVLAVLLARRAIQERRTVVSDVHRNDPADAVHLTVAAPLLPGEGEPREAVLVRIDPSRSFFPMVQSWPTPSVTAESLLVRGEEGRVTVVNELRHRPGQGESLSVPLSRSEDPIVRAAAGAHGVAEGTDYRGARVLAAIAPIPDTPWTLVAKIDVAEALGPLRDLAAWMIAGVLALLSAAAAGTTLWWRAERAASERARVHDEAERNALARRIERLTRYAGEMVFLADGEHRLLEVNDRAVALLGYEREELLAMNVRDLRDPATLHDFEARASEQIARGAATYETRFRRKDGSSFPVEVTAQTETVEGRRYFHGIVRDVTERRRSEEALRASEAKFRAAFEFASLGVILVDADGKLVDTNRAARRMLGRREEEVRGLAFADVHLPADRPSAEAILRQMREGAVTAVELPRRLLRKNGTLAEVTVRASALRDDVGAFRFALAVMEDVTDRKRLEAQLVLADRMASVGTLAAGVAHEINNPLAFILANLEFALGELRHGAGDPEVLRSLQEARDGGLRVREIVRDLKAFSRADAEARDTVDVHQVLQSAIGVAQNEIRHRARLEVDVGEVPPVTASEHRLGQVFLNLLINAAQSIPEGRATENVIRAVTATAADGRAVVEISDTGCGIPPEVLPRIFDPFFTTKPVGVGTGLGLSICHGIVSGMGGEIQVESSPAQGSTFRVLLLPARPPARSAARAGEGPARSRRGRILVVDDEALVGRAVNRILAPQHEVVTHTSARAALDDLGGDGAFDVLLCDLMMPDMTGMELHAKLRQIAPALAERTVFLTGGAFTPGAHEFLGSVPNPRIEKPFDPEALRALVARVLAEAGPAAPRS